MSACGIGERMRRSGAWLVSLTAGTLLAFSIPNGAATAHGAPGGPDSTLVQSSPSPVAYETSYNRDISSGTWTQTLLYGLSRGRMSLSASGSNSTTDFPRSAGLGGQNGAITGALSFRAQRSLVFTLNGTFNRVVSTDLVSETSQRQNRLKVSGQYNINPWRSMSLQGVVSSELQRDHGLTVRPLGQERLRLLTRYNAAGDSVGVDSIFVHDQRDSTYMSGRQDGASVQMVWSPKTWFQVTTDASGTRVHPRTTGHLRDFARALDGSPVEVLDRSRFESPNESETYQTKLSYGGIHRVLAWANVREVHNTQQYFDKSLRGQEQLSIDQRGGLLHAEFAPMVGAQIAVEGSMNRSLSEYALRANRSSLVTSQTMQTSFNFSPSSGSRASAVLNLDRKKNERQATGNGLNISRFLQVNGAYRLSPRLALDAAGTVSLFSSQYVDSTLDQD